MTKIIDTHTHGYFGAFDADREGMIQRAKDAGVIKQIQIGCDETSSLAALELAQQHDGFFSSVGLHPTDVFRIGQASEFAIWGWEEYQPKAKSINQLMEMFSGLIANNPQKIKGVGETGLDFYHDKARTTEKEQFESLEAHFALAQKHNLPLIIHMRDATDDMLDFFEAHKSVAKSVGGVIHCFAETLDVAKVFTEKYGFFIGIGGLVTYPHMKLLKEAVQKIPLQYIITETDAPFMRPEEWKKDHDNNEPAALPEIVGKIAELKNMDPEICVQQMVQTAEKLFRI